MADVSKRAQGRVDISSTLKVCPHCLGDLEFRGAIGSGYYACLQCGSRSVLRDHAARPIHAQLAHKAGALMNAEALLNRVPF
jgi:hypothetical protein